MTIPSNRIVEAVCEERGEDPTDVDWVLNDHVDPDALDNLLTGQGEVEVCFELAGVEVSANSANGGLEVNIDGA